MGWFWEYENGTETQTHKNGVIFFMVYDLLKSDAGHVTNGCDSGSLIINFIKSSIMEEGEIKNMPPTLTHKHTQANKHTSLYQYMNEHMLMPFLSRST